jgi:hypothetical protein
MKKMWLQLVYQIIKRMKSETAPHVKTKLKPRCYVLVITYAPYNVVDHFESWVPHLKLKSRKCFVPKEA